LDSNKLYQADDGWTMYFPCGYDEIDKEIDEMPIKDGAKYFIIDNIDTMTAKEWLWLNVLKHHGYNKAITLMPVSYVLYYNDDLKKFEKEHHISKLYIMKKNIQRQEGLKISKDKKEILDGIKNNYTVVQELLQDPYIIDGRKTNMRFYLLLICKGNDMDAYVYNDGFMYYTRVPFVKGSTDFDVNVTTGYIDRSVYDKNPLTHQDLRKYLDDPNRKLSTEEINIRTQGLKVSQVCFSRIFHLLREVCMSFIGNINRVKKLQNNVVFQLFGIDVAVNDQLQPMIIEVNKGPDLGAKDPRDRALKEGVAKDIFKLVGAIKSDGQNGFVQILDVTNGNINSTKL